MGGAQARSMIQVYLDPVGEDREAALIASLEQTLADVRLAVDDFHAMRALMRDMIEELATATVEIAELARAEYLTFLQWLEGDRFVFLGARRLQISAPGRWRLRGGGAGYRRGEQPWACCATTRGWCCGGATSRPCCRTRYGAC
jgi:NAD-specific glutamate dehydrogenase